MNPKIDIGIAEKDRKHVVQSLSQLLADTYALYVKTQNFHWNITGPQFDTLHATFQREYEDLREAADVIAERIRSLGFLAPGGLATFEQLTSIKDSDGSLDAAEMVKELLNGHELIIRFLREALPAVDKVHDEATSDLLVQRLETHEKTAWMLRSSLPN